MNEQVIEGEHRSLAVVGEVVEEPKGDLALFGTSDPVDVIARATRVADALKAVVVSKKLVSNIQGKEYPQVEAWQTLAVMLGIAAVCEWTREIPNGWEARVVAQRNGLTIAAAEAQCTRDEKSWKTRDAYALRSMAQTRAVSKALRSVLGFVMVLAGYQATPAEEVPPEGFQPRKESPPKPGVQTFVAHDEDTPANRERGIKAVHALAREHKIDLDAPDSPYRKILLTDPAFAHHFIAEDGKPAPEVSSKALTYPELRRFYAALKAHLRDVPA